MNWRELSDKHIALLQILNDEFVPSPLCLLQGLRIVTLTYVLTILLLTTFISQSWGAPKVAFYSCLIFILFSYRI